MAKSKAKSYRVLLNEPRTTIGSWSHDLVAGDVLELSDEIAAALMVGENPLVAPVDGEEADG